MDIVDLLGLVTRADLERKWRKGPKDWNQVVNLMPVLKVFKRLLVEVPEQELLNNLLLNLVRRFATISRWWLVCYYTGSVSLISHISGNWVENYIEIAKLLGIVSFLTATTLTQTLILFLHETKIQFCLVILVHALLYYILYKWPNVDTLLIGIIQNGCFFCRFEI